MKIPESSNSNESSPAIPSRIVLTAPSPPDTPSVHQPDRHHGQRAAASQNGDELAFHRTETLALPTARNSMSFFEQLLDRADMPEPGPAYFDARRALWKTANPHPTPKAPEFPDSTATSRRRLDTLLADPTIDLESDQVWFGQGSLGGLDKVWKSLSNGSRLKRRLPLPSLIRLLRVGWVRDGTWPKGGVAPDSDDDFLGGVTTQVPSAATSQYPSAISTPVGERPEYLVSHRQVRSVFGK